jgi:hypothetical protein
MSQPAGSPAYQSPDGTYEKVLKSVLEDTSFTFAEFRVLLYLATKPDDWIIRQKQLEQALDIGVLCAKHALAGLRARGYIEVQEVRASNGKFSKRISRLCRDLVIKEETPGQSTGSVIDRVGDRPGGSSTGWVTDPLRENVGPSEDGLDRENVGVRDADHDHLLTGDKPTNGTADAAPMGAAQKSRPFSAPPADPARPCESADEWFRDGRLIV